MSGRTRSFGAVLLLAVTLVAAPAMPSSAADVPGAPGAMNSVRNGTQETITWEPATASDSPITGYEVSHSTDDRRTWVVDGETSDTTLTVTAPPAGRFWWFRVVALSDAGRSEPNELGERTPGVSTQRFVVRTAAGQPLTNGRVSWSDGNGTWSRYYPLSADGVVDLPKVSPDLGGVLRVEDAVLPSGVTMTYKSFSVTLGTDAQYLVLPDPPPTVSRTITVLMPDGRPVVNAELETVTTYGLLSQAFQDGFYYTSGLEGLQGRTDRFGRVTLRGWTAEGFQITPAPVYPYPQEGVQLIYRDPLLHQEGVFPMTGADTTIQLQPMPYLTGADPTTTALGETRALTLTVHPAGRAAGARTAATAATISGVKVTVTPPHGWKSSRCKTRSTLTGTTDARGRVTLRVCASKSGSLQVAARGAVPTGPLTLRVRRAAPMPPREVAVRSRASGQLAVSWIKPLYASGAITKYTLRATAPGEKARSYDVAAKYLHRTLTGLARAKQWTVSVSATSRYGRGDAASASTRTR